MPAGPQIVAFAPTTDMARAEAFYRDVLGLELVAATDFGLEFDAWGTPVRVTRVEALQVQPHTVLGFRVTDIAAAVNDLASRGVVFERYDSLDHDELGVWTAPSGSRVAWFRDPDGNVLSLEQPPTPPAA